MSLGFWWPICRGRTVVSPRQCHEKDDMYVEVVHVEVVR